MTAALLIVTLAGLSIGLAATATLGPRDEPCRPGDGTEAGRRRRIAGAGLRPIGESGDGDAPRPGARPGRQGGSWCLGLDGGHLGRFHQSFFRSEGGGERTGRTLRGEGLRSDLEPMLGTTFKAVLAAAAGGTGPDWTGIDPAKIDQPITFRLRRDDVPIEGRLVSLEGRPLGGVSVKIAGLVEVPPAVMAKMRDDGNRMQFQLWGQLRNALHIGQDGKFSPVRTGPDGRFRLTGIGRDRLVNLYIEGGPVEWTSVLAFTASDPSYRPILLPGGTGKPQIEGPRFERAVAPGRTVEGTVRDRDTRRPIAKARRLQRTRPGADDRCAGPVPVRRDARRGPGASHRQHGSRALCHRLDQFRRASPAGAGPCGADPEAGGLARGTGDRPIDRTGRAGGRRLLSARG